MGHIACAIIGVMAGLLIAALLGMAHQERRKEEMRLALDAEYDRGLKDGRAGDM